MKGRIRRAQGNRASWKSFVGPVVLIALGSWRQYVRWGSGAGGDGPGWLLIVVGLASAATIGLNRLMGEFAELDSPADGAEGIAGLYERLYCGAHEYRRANGADMRGLDRRFYESATAALAAAGFRPLGDVVDATSERAVTWARAVVRVMVREDGTVTAGIYHLKFRGFPRLLQWLGVAPRDTRFVSLETELADGTFVTTGNDREINTTSKVPGVARLQLTVRTPPEVLLSEHARNLRHVLSCKPGVQPLALRTLKEVLESQNRLEELKSAHRASPQFDMAAEVERSSGGEPTYEGWVTAHEAQRIHRARTARGARGEASPED